MLWFSVSMLFLLKVAFYYPLPDLTRFEDKNICKVFVAKFEFYWGLKRNLLIHLTRKAFENCSIQNSPCQDFSYTIMEKMFKTFTKIKKENSHLPLYHHFSNLQSFYSVFNVFRSPVLASNKRRSQCNTETRGKG